MFDTPPCTYLPMVTPYTGTPSADGPDRPCPPRRGELRNCARNIAYTSPYPLPPEKYAGENGLNAVAIDFYRPHCSETIL